MVNNNAVANSNSILRVTGHGSTPKHNVISFQEWVESSNTASEMSGSRSSTPMPSKKIVSEEEKAQLSDELKNKEREYDQLVKLIEKKLTKALKEYSLESETLSQAEEVVCEVAVKYPLRLLGDVLTGIYIKCYDQQNVIAGICSSLERFDASEVSPWGQSIVIGLVNHKSDLVKERVISLIENWGDTSLLTVLKNIDISSTWMREYVNGVIAYLEDKQCIM